MYLVAVNENLFVALIMMSPMLSSLVTFATYAFLGNELTAARVFTAVALFGMVRSSTPALQLWRAWHDDSCSSHVVALRLVVLCRGVVMARPSQIRVPLMEAPMAVASFLEARVAVRRLWKFLHAAEVRDMALVSTRGVVQCCGEDGGWGTWRWMSKRAAVCAVRCHASIPITCGHGVAWRVWYCTPAQ